MWINTDTIQARASYFLAEEIPQYIYYQFFKRQRKRGRHAEGFHHWMREKVPAVLVILTCTALHHALKEWEKNGGSPPQKSDAVEATRGKKKEEWEYYFNRLNDGGEFFLCSVNRPGSILVTSTRDLYATHKHMEWAPEPILGKGIRQRESISKWPDFTRWRCE